MVQQVVAGGDLIEHGADGGRRACFVPASFWLSARRGHGYSLPAERRFGSTRWPHHLGVGYVLCHHRIAEAL